MILTKRHVMGLRNQLVCKVNSKNTNQEGLDEESKLRLKYDRNAILSRKFPVKSGEYNYPERGLEKKYNPLYCTNYMNYGRLLPT